MINIAICGNTSEFKRIDLKNQIESILENTLYSVYVFNTLYQCEESPTSFDVYIIDIDSSYDNLVINNEKSYFIFVGNNLNNIIVNNNMCHNYFVRTPLNYEKISEILNHIRKKIQKSHCIVRTTKGDTRIAVKELKYVDIQGRSLCYHMSCGHEYNSLTLTSSFYNAITPLDKLESLIFLKPSLLINLNKVKTIGTNTIIFEDGETLYLSNPNVKKIKEAWKDFFEFENG